MMKLDRGTARQEVRARWRDIITEYTDQAREKVNGKPSYICPFCGHGTNGDGLTHNPKGKPGNLKCFGCSWSGDIIDLISQHTGADYNTALTMAAGEIGIEIEPTRASAREDFADNRREAAKMTQEGAPISKGMETPTESGNGPQEAKTSPQAGQMPDYSAYYAECEKRLEDPRAAAYITGRGISIETARRYNLGFDPQADPAKAPGAIGDGYRAHPAPRIIIPVTTAHYIGRSIDPATEKGYRKMNNAGAQIDVFNARALEDQPGPVFVTEGAFDALAILETGARAVAINSTSNTGLLLYIIDRAETPGPFILCLDSDDAGQRAQKELEEGLKARGLPVIAADICGGQKDPNEALIANRGQFEADIKKATEAAEKAPAGELPGLLTYSEAVNVFETADDRTLELKSFPDFSKTAKIQLHDSVVIAADTGAGKSSLAINFLNDVNKDYPVIYFNLEMGLLQVLRRLTAIYSGIELDRIEGYKNDPKTAEAVNVALKALTDRQPLQVLQSKDAPTVEQIEEIIKRSTRGRQEPTIVFIDHSLLVNTKAANNSRYDRFTQISETLRHISLNYNIILFVLLQQNRAGKAADDERPRNSSLKESGSWENDATHIVFLWYDPADRKKKLILTKNRNGEAGEFILNYWKKTQTYTEATDAGPGSPAADASGRPHKPTKRERQQQKLLRAFDDAYINTWGKPTLHAMAEAADVTTSTIKAWIKEYGGCTIDGQQQDPAGIDTAIDYTGFVRLTPADNSPFDDPGGEEPSAEAPKPTKRL